MAHSNESKEPTWEEVEEEEIELGIHAVRERTDQSDSESESEDIEESPEHSEIVRAHTESQESSCEGHLGDQHHTVLHSESSSDIATEVEKTNSTFKADSPSSSMGDTMKQTTLDKGVTGLANMRNTCYMNSTLQALRHNTELSAFFLEQRHTQWIDRKPSSPKVELVKGYADLLKSLWSGSKPAYIRPQGFIQAMIPAAVAAGFDQFQIPLQHDSHEFLTFMLDQLHEGMAEEVNIEINRPPPVTERDRAIQQALEAWKRYFGKQYSPFTEMIYGLLQITMTCETCKTKSNTWETFNCLKLPVPIKSETPVTLESMLNEEFQEETIEGYACDKCSPHRTVAKRTMRIWRLPRMVVLVLKRFTPDLRKIYTDFTFPQADPIVFQRYFSPDSPEPSQQQPYECFATVDHHGSSGGGHYNAQAKSPLTEKWNLFDDETASPISEPNFGVSTYILFLKPSAKAAPA
jgi:ubiquitin carboxyl-terminal hydrolase 8